MPRFTLTRSLWRRVATLSAVTALLVTSVIAAPAAQAALHPEYPYDVTDYNEPLRGQFHFSSQGGWMNDVNAPLYYSGVY